MYNFEEHKNLSKFEKEFLKEFLNDIEKRENSMWSKSWDFVVSQNAFTGHKYSGLNALFIQLMSKIRGFDDPRFATFNQAKKNGYHIEKGSKGLPIQFFSFINKETKKPWNEAEFREKTKNMTPEERGKELEKKIALVKVFHVFNAKNIINNENKLSLSENIPLPKLNKNIITNEKIDEFEKELIKGMNVGFREIHSEGAYYTPATDTVTVPLKEQFTSYEERVAVLLHELGHATGHESRLDRVLSTTFADTNYSKEEMKVEMNSVFMTNILGLDLSEKQRENHLIYLDSWGKQVKSQPKEFLKVLADSLKIKDYMIEKGKFNEIFLEDTLNKELEINQDELNTFMEAFHEFYQSEYDEDMTKEELLEDIIEDNFIVGIAYTEMYDDDDLIRYDKQVSYDLNKSIVINNFFNEYLDIDKKESININDYSDFLKGNDFSGLMNEDSFGMEENELTNILKLTAYTKDISYLENYIKENQLEANTINTDLILKNKNYLLRDFSDDTIAFFENHNITIDDNFIKDLDYKNIINFQKSHYEKIEEDPMTNEIIYIPDIELDDKTVYPSYRDLWEEIYKNDFIEDINSFTMNELKSNDDLLKSENILDKLSCNYPDIEIELSNAKAYELSIKEVDLDNDGVPDRIDIDDNRNSVQTVSDLSLVGNDTENYSLEKEEKENERMNEREVEEDKQVKQEQPKKVITGRRL